ncbi:hypothetical protein SAMN05216215_106746 [Saccharopolyspora shandongensis]|uniref:Uncharacterized protein n=1 Tax=Saccharopolyspora shandongensis TaxID=418495 RepID=A0A1H3SMN2_9PSEU|nr:hypothetical protein [Saccharopolyspora shandongensis]SDZ39232.1 hypothetical protein SAMN05216215_106746 [Saccharopolyspora shandongensis]
MIEVVALRQSWAQPGEPICWVIDAQGKYLFEVAGRDATGNPKKGFASRIAGGVGGALLEIADGALGGSEANYQDAPAGVVVGGQPDCAAASLVDVYRQHGGRAVWVLSDRRMALVGVSDPEETPAAETGSLFSRARRMGAGLLSGGGDDGSAAEPAEVVDDGPAPPVVRSLGEWPRSVVAACDVMTRKLGREYKAGKTHYLKIQLADGSALEIGPSAAEDDGRRLVAMSYGRA